MTLENIAEKDLQKELKQLSRKYKKLELDYKALSLRHEQTERLRNFNEAAKELSNFYNRLLLKNTPNITFMLNRHMEFVLGSEKTVAFLGRGDVREIVGVPLDTLFSGSMSEDWIAGIRGRCASVISTGTLVTYEEKVTLKDEGTYIFQITIAPAAEEDGECQGVVVVMNDVTERNQAESALEKRLEQQGLMAELSQNFISSGDEDSLITNALKMAGEFMDMSRIMLMKYENQSFYYQYEWCNPSEHVRAKRGTSHPLTEEAMRIAEAFIKGTIAYFTPEETGRERILQLYDLDDVETLLVLPIYASGKFWGFLEFNQCDRCVPWSSSNINLGEMIAGILSVALTRQDMEKDLLRMSYIINSAPQYIAYIDSEGNFDFFNPATHSVTGFSHDELTAGGLQILYSDETNRRIRDEILPKIFELGKYEFEIPLIRKDGAERIMAFSAFTIMSDQYACGTIATDVTEQKYLEKQLIEAKELAEQHSRTKSEFLSRMSHEMRTPMNAIIGMTSIGKSADNIERKDYCLDKIDSASTHLLGVINDVLDMSKIEAGKFELSYTDFSLEKMLIKITGIISFRMEEKAQRFEVKIDPDVPQSIISDEQRLNQVITNLLSNAVKFTPDNGTISLFVRKLADADGVSTLQFEVKDTGIGLSKEQQKNLFRSFEQADGSVSRKYGGTGLGLAISKTIVEMMDGRIWVESEPDAGASFIFNIRAENGNSSSRILLSAESNWSNLRILAVDDDQDVLDYFVSITDPLKLQCMTAASGAEACGLIEAHGSFNIIFIDWKMPEMNGIELTKLIKSRYADNTIVIMISATEWSHIETEAKQAGVDKFIPKPLFSSVIIDCINECLDLRSDGTAENAGARDDENIFEGKHILLAEDVEVNREIVIALLEDTGITIDCAENGGIAYEMYKDNPDYDMIFMDIHMPEVSGYEAAKMIRAMPDPRAQAVPIIAMTANVFREDIEKCLESGMNAHVGKPLDIEDVMNRLRQYLLPGLPRK